MLGGKDDSEEHPYRRSGKRSPQREEVAGEVENLGGSKGGNGQRVGGPLDLTMRRALVTWQVQYQQRPGVKVQVSR